MAVQVRVLDGLAAPSEASKRFKAKLETHFEDAGLQEDPLRGETAFFFSEGLVIFRERRVEVEDEGSLVERLAALEALGEEELLGAHASDVTEERFRFRVILAPSALMAVANDREKLAKLLFLETGTLGAAEMSMVEGAVLDFGENLWAVSPVGVLLAGEFPDPMGCLYLVAQTMVGVATYMAIAGALEVQLYEAPPTFTEKELTDYETRLEKLHDTTSFVINDVRDEMLNADPRAVLIIRRLHEAMSIEGHEARVRLFLDVAKRKVDRARAVKASREAKRFSAILFSFSMIVGVSNVLVIWVNLTRNLGMPLYQAVLIELPIIAATVAIVLYLFKEIFQRTLRF